MKYLCKDCKFRTNLYFHIKNHFNTKQHKKNSKITGENLDKNRFSYKQIMVNY
jgi:hypothetical protein